IFENQSADNVMQNAFMKSLATEGIFLFGYHGVTHPSQPNYIAAVAGSTLGVADDSSQDLDATSLRDLLEEKGISWKAYMEDLPKDKAKTKSGLYFRKHNPFISFDAVRNDPARLEKIVNATQLALDVEQNALAQYSWFTPNIQNDGHSIPHDFERGN